MIWSLVIAAVGIFIIYLGVNMGSLGGSSVVHLEAMIFLIVGIAMLVLGAASILYELVYKKE